jgi:hypothetical protein
MEDLIRPVRAAEQIGITKSLLSYHMRHGNVEVVIVGGVNLIPRHEVERLKEKYNKKGRPKATHQQQKI